MGASTLSADKCKDKGSSLSSIDESNVVVHCMEVMDDENTSNETLPQESETLAQELMASLRRSVQIFALFRYATPHDVVILFVGYLCAILSGAALPLTNFILGRVTQDFSDLITKDLSSEDFQPSVDQYALYFVYLGVAVSGLSFVSTFLLAERGEALVGRVRQHYFAAIIKQNTAYFEQIGHSEVTRRIIDDTHLIQEAISENSGICLAGLANFISAIIVGFVSSWKITFLMICAFASITICALVEFTFIKKWKEGMRPLQDGATALVSQMIQSIHTATAMGSSQAYAKRLNVQWNFVMAHAFWRTYIIAFVVALSWFIVYSSYALGFWQGSREVENGTIDIGNLITTITAIVMGGFTLSTIWPTVRSMGKGIEAGRRIFEIIDHTSTVDPTSEHGLKLDNLQGQVEFQNVTLKFAAKPDRAVLDNFSLTVNKGETVAIVGPPESGKSVLLGLLERYYDPIKGTIFIDGVDITCLNVQSLRHQIAYVSQEPFLFSGTIYENVAQGFESTSFAQQPASVKLQMVIKACHSANAWGFILSLPDRLESQVGERGSLLTTSQRQRIAIARAIVSNPKIFLLDEATSALAPRSEQAVQDALREIYRDKTTLVVTRKLNVLRQADKIVVMSEGKNAVEGTHLELMNSNPWYANFVGAQRDTHALARNKPPPLMFNRDRRASEMSVRSNRAGQAFDAQDWASAPVATAAAAAQDSIIDPVLMPAMLQPSTRLPSLSSTSLIGMVSILTWILLFF